MMIPDQFVYASIPVVAGGALWIGRQFVRSVDSDAHTEEDQPVPTTELSLRDYQQLSEVLKQELDTRYMLASEMRNWFARIERQNAQLAARVDTFIAEHRHDSASVRP
jgi:hypothetical protein